MTRPLFPVGPRGCDKTTTGMALVKAIDFRFVGADCWLQSHVQTTVAEIIEREGWGGFRTRETTALQAITAPVTAVTTGGGIILTEFSHRYMCSRGAIIYLGTPVSVLVDRLKTTSEEGLRLTLAGKPLTGEVQEVLAQHGVLCREAVHYIIDTTNPSSQVAEDVLRILTQAAPRLQGGVCTQCSSS